MPFTPSENPITHPERESYTELRPFRFWCQTVLPLVYDNSLSYYELLCKVVDYLNKTMEDVDHMNTDMDTLYSNFQQFQEGTIRIYNELVAYVNAYFENLDVQEEINNKLDDMVTSGALVTILQPTIADEVSDWLENHLTPTEPSIDNTLSVSGAGADALKTGQNFATPYSVSNTYKLGDYVLYNGNVYRCIEPVETAEAFNYLKWLFVSSGDEFTRIRNLINDNHDYENIINEKLSIDTNTRVVYKFSATNLDKEHPTGYVTAQNGTIKFNKAGDHAIIKLQNTLITKITLPPNSAIVGQVYICDSLGNIYSSLTPNASSETSIEIPPNIRNSATIYINWFNAYGDRTAFPQYCFFEYVDPSLYQFVLSKTNAFNAVSMFGDYGITKTYYFADCMTYAGWASVNNQGVIAINNAGGGYFAEHRHIILQSRNIKSIRLNGTDAPAVSAAIWVEDPVNGGSYANWGSGASPEYHFAEPTEGYLYLNSFKDSPTQSFAKSFTIEYWDSEELYGNYAYHNSVRKPFTFNNKTAVFVGDSITRGYTSGSTITNENYPKLFSEIVNLTPTNMGVGGASFTRVDNYPCIQDQLTEANKNVDFLFIAGGINDWQLGVDLDTFKTTMATICAYINQNFSSQVKVIWITPINNTDYTVIPGYAPICKVQDYRNALTEIVTVNDTYNRFSIVQGNTFNFPSKKGSFANAVFGDGLHPSESGYKNVYVPCLINALI